MDFSAARKRFGYIRILDYLMAVIVNYHFNALSGTTTSNWCRDWSHSGRPRGYQLSSTCTDALGLFSSSNIFVPGLFVPTLFVMHDQLLMW
ncbi:hypothetical protein K492DRAFT_176294 [Lichtheimia hyalospora FSU 10163]|nr:hypothetical protein K492DRAFT_176294 [Lichtheimia hyalospora FSU 10163]